MKFLYFLLILFAAGCKETDLDLDIPYSGDKLVLWGKLKAGAPVRIQVTKTFNPVGLIPKDVSVPDAKVTLEINGKTNIELSPLANEKGIYVSDHAVVAGATYIIKASAPALPDAESAPVSVPLNLPDVEIVRTRNVPGEINHQSPQDLVSLYFKEQQADPEKYYTLTFLSYYEKDTLSANTYGATDNIPAKEEDCHTWASEKISSVYIEVLGGTFDRFASVFLVKSKCLPDPGIPIKFYVEAGRGTLDDPRLALKTTMRLEVVTKEAFDFAKIEYDQPEGVDHLVLPPQRALTNIKNGYGLIFASNDKVIEIP
ncbi:DUF4249 domain-containing protein [Dyadobacter fermentans]|uniref:DUF4249 domain-containing protein n=1 Tax=Dyadobacter fermentans (strain ATCC 700827 / DSM 18053 / CIP 107007 / KCTC 52180 / NS114) TaxID=471854 RepID=C6VT02_DYAFD|nr:DUF4249 domain-containing protein [Dyadobacter fermentans]ACT94647.1 hypothetical protein Dfer_3437 [Dyadobacter fermentans DSM 18053]